MRAPLDVQMTSKRRVKSSGIGWFRGPFVDPGFSLQITRIVGLCRLELRGRLGASIPGAPIRSPAHMPGVRVTLRPSNGDPVVQDFQLVNGGSAGGLDLNITENAKLLTPA